MAKSIKEEVYGLHNCQKIKPVILSKESHISMLKIETKVNLWQKSSQTNTLYLIHIQKKVVIWMPNGTDSKNINGEQSADS